MPGKMLLVPPRIPVTKSMDENERATAAGKVSSPTLYSTLEVDEEANQHSLPKKFQGVALHPSVAEDGTNILPQVGPNRELDLPEATQYQGPEAGGRPPAAKSRICGMRKKPFWILAAIILITVVGAAVGGGVGGSLAGKDSSATDSSTQTSTNTSTPATLFLSDTSLAAVNFTQGSVEHHVVFFQTHGDGIYQSAWNSSGRAWTVSPVSISDNSVSRSELFKTPTPITAAFYACSSNYPSLTLYFLDAASPSRLRQLQKSNPNDPAWTLGPADQKLNILADTRLASYGCGDPASYPDTSNAWYQDDMGYYEILDPSSGNQQRVENKIANEGIKIVQPPQNASLTVFPQYNRTTHIGLPLLSLFYTTRNTLYHYHYTAKRFVFMDQFDDVGCSAAANLGAFSFGYNDKLATPRTLQVLFTMPDDAGGGIQFMRRNKIANEGRWEVIGSQDAENPFRDVARYSGLAATQAGRVYAVVEGDGGEVELREWEYFLDEDVYKVVGAVNTEVPER